MRRLLPLALLWLVWTNPPDPDFEYLRFFATQDGRPDTLWSERFYRHGVDEFGTPWVRSLPAARDSCQFSLPRGTWHIGCVAGDTTGFNESGPSNIVTGTIADWTVLFTFTRTPAAVSGSSVRPASRGAARRRAR